MDFTKGGKRISIPTKEILYAKEFETPEVFAMDVITITLVVKAQMKSS